MDSIGTMNEDDKRILTAAISVVDITEAYSPVRVAAVAAKFGLTPGASFDLTNGWDFNRDSHRTKAWKLIKEQDPYCIIGSPPCTMFSMLQELSTNCQEGRCGVVQEARGAGRTGDATHRLLLCIVQIPVETGETLYTRASMVGKELEHQRRQGAHEGSKGERCLCKHVPIRHDYPHRHTRRCARTSGETDGIYDIELDSVRRTK